MNEEEAKRILKDYVEHWDRTIQKWKDPARRVRLRETDPFLRVFGNRIALDLMPEPYWGNVDRKDAPGLNPISVVIANHNPAGSAPPTDNTAHRRAWEWLVGQRTGDYSTFARTLPVFGALPPEYAAFERYAGRTHFWNTRIAWGDQIALRTGLDTRVFRPVGMELCGWHFDNWNDDDAKRLFSMPQPALDSLVRKPFEAALTLSESHVGLFVGSIYERLLQQLGFLSRQGWGCFPVNEEDGRSYLLAQKGNLRVLVTKSKVLRQRCPAEPFRQYEASLLNGNAHLTYPSCDNPVLERIRSLEGSVFPVCKRGATSNTLIVDEGPGWFLQYSISRNLLQLELHERPGASIPESISEAADRLGMRRYRNMLLSRLGNLDWSTREFRSVVQSGREFVDEFHAHPNA